MPYEGHVNSPLIRIDVRDNAVVANPQLVVRSLGEPLKVMEGILLGLLKPSEYALADIARELRQSLQRLFIEEERETHRPSLFRASRSVR